MLGATIIAACLFLATSGLFKHSSAAYTFPASNNSSKKDALNGIASEFLLETLECTKMVASNPEVKIGINQAVFIGSDFLADGVFGQLWGTFEPVQIISPGACSTTKVALSASEKTNLWIFAQNVSSVQSCLAAKRQKEREDLIAWSNRVFVVPMDFRTGPQQIRAEFDDLKSYLGPTNKIQCLHPAAAVNVCKAIYVCPYCCPNGTMCTSSEKLKNSSMPAWLKLVVNPQAWDFNGASVDMTYVKWFKNWYFTGWDSTTGKPMYDGTDYHMAKMLADKLNFSMNVKYPETGLSPGAGMPNGSWTGAMGAAQRNEVDFVLSSLGLSIERAAVADFSTVYDYTGMYILQASPSRVQNAFYSILTPLDRGVWHAYAITLVMVEGTLMLFRLFNRHFGISGTGAGINEFFLVQLAFGQEKSKTAVTVSQGKRKGSLHEGPLLASWVILATLLSMGYSAVYYNHMVSPAYTKPIESVSDLVNSDYQWLTIKGTLVGTAAMYKPLGDKAIYYQLGDSTTKLIKANPRKVVGTVEKEPTGNSGFGDEGTMREYQMGMYYFSREPLTAYWKGVVVPTNSPVASKLTPTILRLFETGICSQNARLTLIRSGLIQFSYSEMRAKQALARKNRRPSGLTIWGNLLGSLIVLGVGLGLSIVAFFCELAWDKIKMSPNKINPAAGGGIFVWPL